MDRFSFVIYPPYNLALLGVVLLFMGTVFTVTGKVAAVYHGVIRRSDDPNAFWFNVVLYYLGGLAFLVKFYLKFG